MKEVLVGTLIGQILVVIFWATILVFVMRMIMRVVKALEMMAKAKERESRAYCDWINFKIDNTP